MKLIYLISRVFHLQVFKFSDLLCVDIVVVVISIVIDVVVVVIAIVVDVVVVAIGIVVVVALWARKFKRVQAKITREIK